MARKVDGAAVQRMRKAGMGRKQELITESWAERTARVTAEREARRLEREAEEQA